MFDYLPTVIFLSMILMVIGAVIGALVIVVMLLRTQQRKAVQAGYLSLAAYLRAAPRTDEERRDAADLALKGLVMCLLGLVFPPLMLIGLFPFFYGTRKLIYASMGLGLIDDADGPTPRT